MTNPLHGGPHPIDVAIIGGGPSGLAAACELKARGIERVVVLEREDNAGGIPRHCGHPPFGLREFKRVLTGPRYAKKLVQTALDCGVEIHTLTTVIEARKDGVLLIANATGSGEIKAHRVIYATGVRETPRSARLVSGARPQGVLNTGALQSMVYLKHCKPFSRPVIIGTELVSYSAIQTCRHGGIKPVAMIEEAARPFARWPIFLFSRLLGLPVHYKTKLIAIRGDKTVNSVEIKGPDGVVRTIECDGVLFTGKFTPESTLARMGHLAIDPATSGPQVDQFSRCSDPVYFAAGNLLRPVETAGWSWAEGKRAGRWVADDLQGLLPPAATQVKIVVSAGPIKYAMPQMIAMPYTKTGMDSLQLRFTQSASGTLTVSADGKTIYSRKMKVLPERRYLIPLADLSVGMSSEQIELSFATD